MRWKGCVPNQDQYIYSNEIEEDVKFRFWQEEDFRPTFQRRRGHRGRPEPRKRSETLLEIPVERDKVMLGKMRTSAVRLQEPVATQLFNLFMTG